MATDIEWVRRNGDDPPGTTWNPTTGCDKVSPGCGLPMPDADPGDPHGTCYALTLARRLKAMGSQKYQTDGNPATSGPGFGVAMHPDALDAPLRWRKPRTVFVNSMSDLFHPKVTDAFIADVWAIMARTPQHTYQILTKRAPRMASLMPDDPVDGGHRLQSSATTATGAQALYDADWPLPNVHLGVSVEDQRRADERIPRLWATAGAVRFLSCEPLLGPVDLSRWLPIGCDAQTPNCACSPSPIDWVIIGGESGDGARLMDLGWARSLVAQCRAAGVAPFVKQLGSTFGAGHKDPGSWPADLRVREYPQTATR